MRVWRVCRKAYAADPLGGRGGLFTSGRWHSRGQRVVYTSGSLALAALEILVHTDRALIPPDLVQVELRLPDRLKIRKLEIGSLPRNWRNYPSPAALRKLGDNWLTSGSTPVLQVPSAVIGEEVNLILNLAHKDIRLVKVLSKKKFSYDPRLGTM